MIRILHFGTSNTCTWRPALAISLAICIIIYIFPINLKTSSDNKRYAILIRINEALQGIENVSQQNKELKSIIENYLNNFYNTIKNHTQKQLTGHLKHQLEYVGIALPNKNNFISHNYNIQPSLEYEELRRRVRYTTQELWYYLSSELEKIHNRTGMKYEISKQIQNTLELGGEFKRSVISNIDRMRTVDGYEKWRQKEAEDLSDLVQRRLNYIQNPKDCKNAKKVVCSINRACGYGCQLHHLIYCFIVAYATERTMIIDSKGWRYHKAGWDGVFQPISETCTDYDVNQAKASIDVYTDIKEIILPVFQIVNKPLFLSLAIPEDLAPRLLILQTDPVSWWISQFYKYLLKPKYGTQKMLQTRMTKLGWKKPIVGVHIRRTDKDTEVPHHSVEEYMKFVEDYYLTLEMNNTKVERRIFLASDDPSVIIETRTKYPHYQIIGDTDVAKTANIQTRYNESSLNGLLADVHMLSLSDYLVCTFSSNLCRSAFGIMQKFYPDAFDRFKSLDSVFSYNGREERFHEVILSHMPRNEDELEMETGDLLQVNGNFWNGFSTGINKGTLKGGIFPNFKVKDITKIAKFPTYPNVG